MLLENSIAPVTDVAYQIDNSLRFNDDDNAYLSRTPASAGNRKTWTWSGWVKRGNLEGSQDLISAGTSTDRTILYLGSDYDVRMLQTTSASSKTSYSASLYRDPSAWYHIIFAVDTTQATASNRVKIYVNGEQVQMNGSATYPNQNEDTFINNNQNHTIGKLQYSADYLDGYMAETHFIDGQALDPSNFGETGDYGEWKPIKYTGTYGSNGFYLDFENSGSLGADVSGNGNNWTPTNLAATDQMLDSPTNNFATLNSTQPLSGLSSLAEGNLQCVGLNATYGGHVPSTFSTSTGKWYFEVNIKTLPSAGGSWPIIGIVENLLTTAPNDDYPGDAGLRGVGYVRSGDIRVNGSVVTTTTGTTTGDIVGVAFDVDAGTCALYLNGTLKYTATGLTGSSYTPDVSNYYNSVCITNFGQDSSFAGNKTAQGNADDNGYGDFYYAPPTGYLALCTQNLPDATVIPSEHFSASLWTGNGTSQSITGVGFQPDWTWIKHRSLGYGHSIYDAVRGATKQISSNATDAEDTQTGGLTSFDSDGFSLGSYARVNHNTYSFVGWSWKANGAGVSNTDGTITSTVSANTDAGFSIVSYEGTGVAATVGHGLSSAPEAIIVKKRNGTAWNWGVYHTDIGNDRALYLNLTNAQSGSTNIFWNTTSPTSSVFSVGTSQETNVATAIDYIAYAFHSVEGYSKVFSYTGNGSADGTFTYCGFRPAYVMIKYSSGVGNWLLFDNTRDIDNAVELNLDANNSEAEENNTNYRPDFLSNGFKVRGTSGGINASGGTYIGIAFAEHPFKHTNAR